MCHSLIMNVEENRNHNDWWYLCNVMVTYYAIVNSDGLHTMVSQMKDTWETTHG